MQKISKVIDVLSREYNFSAEDGLKLYMDSLKKKEKKVRKVEVEDIFTEMSRDVDVVVEKVKEKKPRSDKQLAAFEAMKAKRAANIEAKKAEKGVENVDNVDNEVKKVKKVKKVKETVENGEVEKEKKPRTEKQLAAFEAMKAKRAANLEAKKTKVVVEPVVSQEVESVVSQEVESVVSQEVESVVSQEVEEEVSVKKFNYKGKDYLISRENILYDPENEEAVGKWNEERQEIESCEELEEEEIVE